MRANRNDENGGNQERANEEEAEERGNEVRKVRTSRKSRCREIKFKGGAREKKDKGIKRLFSVSYNGFSP